MNYSRTVGLHSVSSENERGKAPFYLHFMYILAFFDSLIKKSEAVALSRQLSSRQRESSSPEEFSQNIKQASRYFSLIPFFWFLSGLPSLSSLREFRICDSGRFCTSCTHSKPARNRPIGDRAIKQCRSAAAFCHFNFHAFSLVRSGPREKSQTVRKSLRRLSSDSSESLAVQRRSRLSNRERNFS